MEAFFLTKIWSTQTKSNKMEILITLIWSSYTVFMNWNTTLINMELLHVKQFLMLMF
jgi:hypothetical protein